MGSKPRDGQSAGGRKGRPGGGVPPSNCLLLGPWRFPLAPVTSSTWPHALAVSLPITSPLEDPGSECFQRKGA